jgi:hypothetical protein
MPTQCQRGTQTQGKLAKRCPLAFFRGRRPRVCSRMSQTTDCAPRRYGASSDGVSLNFSECAGGCTTAIHTSDNVLSSDPPHTTKKRVLHYLGFLLLGFELGLLHTLMFPGFPQQGDCGRCPLGVSWCILVSVGVLW